jgi:hypothetical protein
MISVLGDNARAPEGHFPGETVSGYTIENGL